ncbi:MAG TPA: hypothetical protein VHH36_08525, partial [Candidatus Thermoplasmatota archaeon]|nr:hypothetical protein [Candidatus Thermoplasmatota archaeon]
GTVYKRSMSEVVQFREDEEKVAHLRRLGINPNEFGRAAFDRAYGKLLAQEAARRMESASRRGDRSRPQDPATAARDARSDLERRGD